MLFFLGFLAEGTDAFGHEIGQLGDASNGMEPCGGVWVNLENLGESLPAGYWLLSPLDRERPVDG